MAVAPCIASGQTPTPAGCAIGSPAAAEALKRQAPVALYYELKLAIVDGHVYEWRGDARPRLVMRQARHVAVGSRHGYAIDQDQRALRWEEGSSQLEVMLDKVAYLAAGDSSVLAIRCDGSLWQRKTEARDWTRIADAAIHAWVGDSADYYIDPQRRLYVTGKAHRGQYGNGQLDERPGWTVVAEDAVAVHSHTGHAVYLRSDGAVLGTGGNRFGPLGSHGYGDKALRWGQIFEGARSLGSGSRHSLAIRPDGSLWTWGSTDGLQPKRVLAQVAAATGGDSETLAILTNGTVWQWRVGAVPQQVSLPQ